MHLSGSSWLGFLWLSLLTSLCDHFVPFLASCCVLESCFIVWWPVWASLWLFVFLLTLCLFFCSFWVFKKWLSTCSWSFGASFQLLYVSFWTLCCSECLLVILSVLYDWLSILNLKGDLKGEKHSNSPSDVTLSNTIQSLLLILIRVGSKLRAATQTPISPMFSGSFESINITCRLCPSGEFK